MSVQSFLGFQKTENVQKGVRINFFKVVPKKRPRFTYVSKLVGLTLLTNVGNNFQNCQAVMKMSRCWNSLVNPDGNMKKNLRFSIPVGGSSVAVHSCLLSPPRSACCITKNYWIRNTLVTDGFCWTNLAVWSMGTNQTKKLNNSYLIKVNLDKHAYSTLKSQK